MCTLRLDHTGPQDGDSFQGARVSEGEVIKGGPWMAHLAHFPGRRCCGFHLYLSSVSPENKNGHAPRGSPDSNRFPSQPPQEGSMSHQPKRLPSQSPLSGLISPDICIDNAKNKKKQRNWNKNKKTVRSFLPPRLYWSVGEGAFGTATTGWFAGRTRMYFVCSEQDWMVLYTVALNGDGGDCG